MKTTFSVLVTVFALSSFATELDTRIESLIVENPTLKNTGFTLSSSAAVYVCKTLGYVNALVLGYENIENRQLWSVSAVNDGFSLNYVRSNVVITKLECQRKYVDSVVKPPPVTQPCDGCGDIPGYPADPTNPYDPKP